MTPNQLTPLSDASMSPAQACKQLIKIKETLRTLKAKEAELNKMLLEVMQVNDVVQLKTGEYTISRSTRITPTVVDFNLARSAMATITEVKTKEVFDDCMMPVIKELIKNGAEIDGIEPTITEYTQVRLNKKD